MKKIRKMRGIAVVLMVVALLMLPVVPGGGIPLPGPDGYAWSG